MTQAKRCEIPENELSLSYISCQVTVIRARAFVSALTRDSFQISPSVYSVSRFTFVLVNVMKRKIASFYLYITFGIAGACQFARDGPSVGGGGRGSFGDPIVARQGDPGAPQISNARHWLSDTAVRPPIASPLPSAPCYPKIVVNISTQINA